jgi:hypothetical protein
MPTAPNLGPVDPEQPIQLRHHRPFVPALVSGPLQPQREVLDSDGLMPRAQQSNQPKHTHNNRQHENGLFAWKVNVLQTYFRRGTMHIQERFHRRDFGHMVIEVTVTIPSR